MPPCASDSCARRQRWWTRSRTGVVLDGEWVCSRACVEALVRERLSGDPLPEAAATSWRGMRLGTLLRHQRACPPEVIDEALAAQSASHLRLGEQLRAMGAVEAQELLKALAAQANVSYLKTVDVATVHDAPGGLALDAVQALRIVPIGPPVTDRIRVACPAPVPRAALTAFRQLTGWSPEPFLVGDDEWLRLVEHYGAGLRGPGARVAMRLIRTMGPDDAVTRVADAVLSAGDATLKDARWGPYVWVRVHGPQIVTDVLFEAVTFDAALAAQEESWPVATTWR
jgi:hypothetical protein